MIEWHRRKPTVVSLHHFTMFTPLIRPSIARTDTGTLASGISYVAVGNGPRTLVLPGFGDALFSGMYPPFLGGRSRPTFRDTFQSTRSTSSAALAGFHPDTMRKTHPKRTLESFPESHRPADVVGISMGGLTGQELARRRPDLVDRLVLANSASRLDEDAIPSIEHLETLARDHAWSEIRSELVQAMFTDGDERVCTSRLLNRNCRCRRYRRPDFPDFRYHRPLRSRST